MFWDGTRWATPRVSKPAPPSRSPWFESIGIAIVLLLVMTLIWPFRDASAGRSNAQPTPPVSGLFAGYRTETYEETDSHLAFTGVWHMERLVGYIDGAAMAATAATARMTVRFTGTGIAWVGPVGPTQGRAKVYLDGRLVKNVDTSASGFNATNVLYSTTFAASAAGTLVVEVAGTKNRPKVAVDAIIVRGAPLDVPGPTPAAPTDAPPTVDPGTPNPPTQAPAPTPVVTAQPPAATPNPTPVVTPQPPAPTPNPTPRPTPAPTPTPSPTQPPPSGFLVPASIDATGGADASAALASFIAGVPNGSTILFRAGAIYRLDTGLRILGRRNLVFDGQGATLRATGTTGAPRSSPFLLENSTGITVRDFKLAGNNPDAGTAAAHHLDRQNQSGVAVYGGGDILITDTTITGTWGDCVYVGANAGIWADGVVYRDSVCKRNGRMGVAVVAGQNVTVARVTFDALAMFVFDIEPDTAAGGAINVTFRDSTAGTYGLYPGFSEYFFGASGADGSTVDGVTVSGNTVTSGKGLRVTVGQWGNPNRVRKNIRIVDNVATAQVGGPIMDFYYARTVTVTGNTQPLSGGGLATFGNCTGVTYSGNST
jgi:hypothetical protein